MSTGLLDAVTEQFLTALQHDSHLIEHAAKRVFYYLAIFQVTLTALWQVVAGESLQRLLADMVKLTFLLGFFYGAITLGSEWVQVLINGFIDVGQQTSIHSLSPSSVVSQGVSIAGNIVNAFYDTSAWKHPFVALVGTVVCISICIIYALIAAELAIVLVKSYVVAATSGLFFAFGGLELTRPMTQKYIQAAIGIGLQLMTLYFLMGVGQRVGSNWAEITKVAAENHELMPMFVMLAAVIVYYMILKNVPSFIAGLAGVGGFHNYGAAAVGMAVNTAMQSVRMGTRIGTRMAEPTVGAVKTAMHLGGAVWHRMRTPSMPPFSPAANDPRFNRAANDRVFHGPPEEPGPTAS